MSSVWQQVSVQATTPKTTLPSNRKNVQLLVASGRFLRTQPSAASSLGGTLQISIPMPLAAFAIKRGSQRNTTEGHFYFAIKAAVEHFKHGHDGRHDGTYNGPKFRFFVILRTQYVLPSSTLICFIFTLSRCLLSTGQIQSVPPLSRSSHQREGMAGLAPYSRGKNESVPKLSFRVLAPRTFSQRQVVVVIYLTSLCLLH